MTAEPIPLHPTTGPTPDAGLDAAGQRAWRLTYNTGYVDGIQSVLNQLGMTQDDLAMFAVLADNEEAIRRRRQMHAVPS